MSRRDLYWIVLLAVLGLTGLGTYLHYYDVAFPIASLDFKLSRDEALAKAQDYVERIGHRTDEYMKVQAFSHDREGQIFLEQTLELEETNRLAREWVSVWFWKVRWFKPLEKEELRVHLDPGGRIVNFQHLILESAEGANLVQDDALPIADRFLLATQGFVLSDYGLIERSSEARQARTDHTFTYRRKGFEVGEDGHYRVEVVVQGDRVGSFKEYIKVPETFSRHHKEVRSRASLLTNVAGVFWFVLGAMMLVVLVQKHRQNALHWKTGLIVGGVVLVATAIGQVNSLPLARFGYDTTQSYNSFIVMFLGFGLIGAAYSGGIICLAGTSAGALGREVLFAGRRSPFGHLVLKRMFSGGFTRSIFVGYGLAFTQLGFLTLFYVVGSRHFGVWSPAAVIDYDNTFSTVLPWIYPLLVGLVAATMEEFFFRLLAISLLLKWLGKRWLAVLFPAVVWGFLHSNYPIEPIYTRGVELTLVGVLLGVVFLRFGIWSTIISHYVYNAFVVAFPMLKSSSLYFQISGAVVVGVLLLLAVPALFGLVTGRYRQVEEEEEEQVAQEVQDKPTPFVAAETTGPHADKTVDAYRLVRNKRLLGGLFALVGVGLLAGLPVVQFGERTLDLSVTRQEAVEAAAEFCRDLGLDLAGYRRSSWFESSLESDQYVHLVRNADLAHADTLASEETNPWLWHVRWFKAEEKEEIEVGIDATGRVVRLDHQIPENQAGPQLDADEARKKVERFVEERFGHSVADGSKYKLLEERSEKRKERVDHHFVWERIDRKVADGEFRTIARLQGEDVGQVEREYKAPEEFIRKLRQQDVKDVIVFILMALLILATLVLGGIYFFQASKAGQLTWRLPIRIGVLLAALQLVDRVNGFPEFFRDYDTSQAMWTFLGMEAVGLVVGVAFTGLAAAIVTALALALFRQLYSQEMEPDQWIVQVPSGGHRLWLETLLLVAALILVDMGADRLKLFVKYQWLTEYLKPEHLSPPYLNGYLPLLEGVSGALSGALALFPLLGIFLIWQRALVRSWVLILGMAVVLVILAVVPADDLYHFGFLAGLGLIGLAVMLFLIVRLVRFNLLVYAIFLWAEHLIGEGWTLTQTADLFYQLNGVALLAFGLAPLVMPLFAYFREGQEEPAG